MLAVQKGIIKNKQYPSWEWCILLLLKLPTTYKCSCLFVRRRIKEDWKKKLRMWRLEVASKLVFLGRLKNEKSLYSKKIFRLKILHTRYYIKQCLIVRIYLYSIWDDHRSYQSVLELNDLVSIQFVKPWLPAIG